MPTYDYECEACGHAFEQWQSFHDEALKQCPKCKKKKLKRLFGMGAAIVFKGSGFYETDYRRDDKYKEAAKADAAGPKPEAKPAETPATPAAETPAAKPESAPSKKTKKPGK